jgi:hypothetical protein
LDGVTLRDEDIIMPIELGSFSVGVVTGGLIVRFFDHILAKDRAKSERKIRDFNEAADKFRSSILRELEGFYPDTTVSDPKIEIRLRDSIPRIKTIAEEFRPYIFPLNEDVYNTALTNYYDYCKVITRDKCAMFDTYPGMHKPGEKHPKEIFRNNVDVLLSFAKNK